MGKPLPNGKARLMIMHRLLTGLVSLITSVLVVFSLGNAQAPEPAPQVAPAVLPSTTTTSTTLPALVTTCAQVATLALAEGLPPSELETALRVAVRESRCTSDAFNASDPNGGSYSIYQINGFWCRPSTYWPTGWLQAKGIVETCDDLFDPTTNTRAMVAIWHNSGWLPWTTAK
jgi:hypothetical protein